MFKWNQVTMYPSLSVYFVGLAMAVATTHSIAAHAQDGVRDEVHSGDRQQDDRALPAPDPSDRRRDEVSRFFEALTRQMQRGDARAVLTSISSRHVLDLLVERRFVSYADERQRELLLRQLRRSLSRGWSTWGSALDWDRFEIKHLEWLTEHAAVVTVRHRSTEWQTNLRMRWWIVRVEESWKIYDFEDLDQSIRVSSLLGLLMQARASGESWTPALEQLLSAVQDAGSIENALWELDSFEELLDELLTNDLPEDLQAFVLTMRAISAQWMDDPDLTWSLLLDLEALPGDRPGVRLMKGSALMSLERYDEALVEFKAYGESLGFDCDVYENMADCYWELGERSKAVEYAERGLQDNELSWGCLATLALALPAHRQSELTRHFERMGHAEGAYEFVLDWVIEQEEMETGAFIFDLFRKAHPESDLLPYYNDIFIH